MGYILIYLFRSLLLLSLLNEEDYFLGVSLVLMAATVGLFIAVNRINPGYLEKEGFGLLEIIDVYRSEYICGYCEVKKPHGTRHCHICGKCVKVGDM